MYNKPNIITSSDKVWNASTGQTVQDNHYYPYGAMFGESAAVEYVNAVSTNLVESSVNPYRYGGKEWLMQEGLNYYDFAARQYDPATGRFIHPDPLNGKYPHLSSYLYCAGNPINATDPSGMEFILDKLSLEDRSKFEAIVESWRTCFKELYHLYQLINESDIVYYVQYLDSSDESLLTQMGKEGNNLPVYISDKSNDGSWSYNIIESNGPTTFNFAEDMFHCYQQINITEYVGNHNLEYEAKLFSVATILNNNFGTGSAFYYEPVIMYLGIYNENNTISNITEKLNSNLFKLIYNISSNIFAIYNIINDVGNENYKTITYINSPPTSLIKLYNSINAP